MDFDSYKALIMRVKTGKQLPDSVYIHISAINTIPENIVKVIERITNALKIPSADWNILKLYKRDFKVAFLHYPDFETHGYPALRHSFTVDLSKLSVRKASYEKSDNPPILHRKDTFVKSDFELHSLFKEITAEGEEIGLYESPRSIGFKKNWERLISNKGYYLDEAGRLHPKANRDKNKIVVSITNEVEIERHKTAIDRNQLSQPMQILAKHNYFNGDYSVLDYGCGKGDDMRELEAHGIDISGWDPVHCLDGDLLNADIVNLGFVINVIEDKDERLETLKRAWEYADKLLIVSVMIAGESLIRQFTPYKDGVITSRNTFQRYFTQSEFRSYIESSLDESAIAVGQGIFIVFKDKIEEQNFLLERQHVRRDWQQKTQRQIQSRQPSIRKDLIDKHLALFTDFWETSLELGRIPANNEFEFSDQIRRVAGSHIKAHKALIEHFGNDLFEEAQSKRKDDLLVYFALGLFGKRKPQTKMPDGLKRDIKTFYNSYNDAIEQAREVLFSMGNSDLIEESCNKAFDLLKSGYLEDGHSYTFHTRHLGDLPPELRIYIGCATQLYGDLDNFHLVKAHMTSGKVSLMRYDDWNKDTPLLVERIKIKMREQDVDFFDYSGKFTPPPLENKKLFI
ncbi:DNA phosphorothioation-associated putative methyltransferase [Pleionea litopenaei]|uniref:DNA phosphorothioation-associated putative methyltransferase n=1 Tax=Pleionea litopenaei TaxID=3070815 RepID=A0AA51RQ79_9GAMM|nr:DNA phosphorothioation-associated putative methyltransferase [Pleionea sp. HL-JVS1]WMS85623.1 DNA phosphorothioation-associated putative methyltransferase [Pleionea sp. HL-JVS1]